MHGHYDKENVKKNARQSSRDSGNKKIILYGIDEAALGPKLGPFCAAVSAFSIDKPEIKDPGSTDLFEILKPTLDKIPVADSKKLYTPSKGTAALENTALSYINLAGFKLPADFKSLIEFLSPPEDLENMLKAPWFKDSDKLILPLNSKNTPQSIEQNAGFLADFFHSRSIVFLKPSLRFITAAALNSKIEKYGGKGKAAAQIIGSLIKSPPGKFPGEQQRPRRFCIDRQGGRRYYGEWLLNIFPGSPLVAERESPEKSMYRINKSVFEFLVKADTFRAETALASVIAKYAREAAMILFNNYWKKTLPGIKSTAGYPQDAQRFIDTLKKEKKLPENRKILIRSK